MSNDTSSETEAKSASSRDSLKNTFFTAFLLCLVCSVLVSGMAVVLKPIQVENKLLDQKKNILRAAGMLPANSDRAADGRSIDDLFAEFTVKAVDLETGEFVEGIDLDIYDPVKAAQKAELSRALSAEEDIATLRRLEKISLVYLVQGEAGIEKLVLPVRGYGLWGTLYGYLALDSDLTTITGLGFYSHKETPGLGGEVDNVAWKASWSGVKAFTEQRTPGVKLVKQRSPAGSMNADYEVDALSGATFTTRGVENLVNFWTGDLGFGRFIQLQSQEQKQQQNTLAQG